jgi:hypothetical protein
VIREPHRRRPVAMDMGACGITLRGAVEECSLWLMIVRRRPASTGC